MRLRDVVYAGAGTLVIGDLADGTEIRAIPAPTGGSRKFCDRMNAFAQKEGLPGMGYIFWRDQGDGMEAAGPLAMLVGIYLLFAGHNNPGGGFAAGLVFGAVVTLRDMAGTRRPPNATTLITVGVIIVIVVAAIPLFAGDSVLDQTVLTVDLPLLGTLKSGSALPFDIGVTAIVVGLVAALLQGMAGTSGDFGPDGDPDENVMERAGS